MDEKDNEQLISTNQEMILIDGYYIPKQIVAEYNQLKEICIQEVTKILDAFCYQVKVSLNEQTGSYMIGYGHDEKIYTVTINPKSISQIEKALGTKKIYDYIHVKTNEKFEE